MGAADQIVCVAFHRAPALRSREQLIDRVVTAIRRHGRPFASVREATRPSASYAVASNFPSGYVTFVRQLLASYEYVLTLPSAFVCVTRFPLPFCSRFFLTSAALSIIISLG